MSVPRLVPLSDPARESLRRERAGLTPRRVTPPEVIAELERAAFGVDDALEDRKMRELAEVAYVPGLAVFVSGLHQCQRCQAVLDDPAVCLRCGIFNPTERYEYPSIYRGPLG